jgi:uncharacterized protein (DUF302 family)
MTSSPDDTTRQEIHAITTKLSPRSVPDTADRLTEILAVKGLKVFAVIDQQDEARRAGLELRAMILIIFGNPAAGTAVMAAAPLAALDLPLKVLVWADEQQTKVSYLDPDALGARYHLTPELAAALAGVNGITDQLISL